MREDSTDLELHAARSRIQAAAKDLGLFLAGSEDVFLDAGRRIAGLEQRARSLVESARAAGAFRTDTGAEDPAVTLGRELSRIVQHLRGSQEKVAHASGALAGLVAQIEILLRARTHFESIPPTLRMLGLNTRIENARSSAQYAGMETVALEVRRLSDEVEPKFRGVFGRAEGLLETVGEALRTAQGFLSGQDALGAELLGETQGALDALQATARAGADIAQRAVAASERLTRDVGALLVALQGHDATRQVVEHVLAELEEVAAGTGGGTGGNAAWRAHLAAIGPVMAAQVRGARERFAASLEALAGSLESISGVGADLSRETQRFAASGADSAAALVARSVDRATRALLQHVAHEATAGDSMSRVVTTIDEMGRSVKDILGIGSAVKIIALNALVETERAGQDGRVLAVLAQGIGSLAGEVVQRTGEVSRTLREISTIAAALRTTAARGDAAEGKAIAAGLEHLGRRLAEIQQGLAAAVMGMHEGSRSLGDEVEALTARVDQARAGADRLAAVEAALTALAAEAADAGGGADAAHEARAFARYTMESERAIHDSVRSGGVPGVGAAPAPAAAVGGGQGDDGLGANVELF